MLRPRSDTAWHRSDTSVTSMTDGDGPVDMAPIVDRATSGGNSVASFN